MLAYMCLTEIAAKLASLPVERRIRISSDISYKQVCTRMLLE